MKYCNSMIANVINNCDIILTNLTPWEEEIVDAHFSVSIPKRQYIDDSSSQGWDGVYRRYNRAKKRLSRTFVAELKFLCNNKNLQISFVDHREPASPLSYNRDDIDENFLPNITLKSFQIEAIKKAFDSEVGIFDICTSGGKTEIAAGLCKLINCQTLILSEQRVVVDQIKNRLQLREVCSDPGVFYSGKRPSGQLITIGTIQSLTATKKPVAPIEGRYKNPGGYKAALTRYEKSVKTYNTRCENLKYLKNIVQSSDMIIVDECDLAVSEPWKNLFRNWYKGRRRYGLTGTPFDDDKPVQALFLKDHLGSVIFKQSREEVHEAGLIVPLKYNMLVFGNPINKSNSNTYDTAVNDIIVNNKSFHALVAAICSKYPDDGTLILVDRDDLGHALIDMIPNSRFYHGKTPNNKRAEIISDFEARKFNVLVGGKNVRRGLDLKGGCENLIIATGGKLYSEFDQRLGRARRLNKRGESRVFDFLFYDNKYLYEHSRKRLKSIINMGYESKVIFKHAAIDGEQFVRSRFRIPKST